MIVGFVTAGILLFGILTSLSVKGRKREIEFYFRWGTQKKDFRTVRFGEFGSGFDCLVFAALCATPTAEYFADRMISNQAEKVEQKMKICREILKRAPDKRNSCV